MFDFMDMMGALTELEYKGRTYLRLKTVCVRDGLETVMVVENASELPATVKVIQVSTTEEEGK